MFVVVVVVEEVEERRLMDRRRWLKHQWMVEGRDGGWISDQVHQLAEQNVE